MNKLIILLILMAVIFPVVSASELSDIEDFLATDQTDDGTYTKFHTCGHFTRELSKNASEAGLDIGAVIVTKNDYPIIKGYGNHAMNYFTINGVIYFIEPQTDMIMTANDIVVFSEGYTFKHARLYSDGTMIPTNFRGKMAATYDLSKHMGEQLPEPEYMQWLMNRLSHFALLDDETKQ